VKFQTGSCAVHNATRAPPDGRTESRYHSVNESAHPPQAAQGLRGKRSKIGAVRESKMEVLVVAVSFIAIIWIVVLWGSRYFGSH
jgi:hypothetical protein